MKNEAKNTHGGKRDGAGRKPVYADDDRPKIRGMKFSDSEWNFIKALAEKENTTIKAVILKSVGFEK